MRVSWLTALATIIAAMIFPLATFAAAIPAPTITYGPTTIIVSGVTPHGKAVLFGASHDLRDGNPPIPQVTRRAEILADADGDGVVQLELGHKVSQFAVWIAVDLMTGAHSGAPSSDFPGASAAQVTPSVLLENNPGALSKFTWRYPEIALLLVRPGTGAWQTYAAKHSALDEHRGTHQPLQIDLGDLTAVGDTTGSPGLPVFPDVVVVIDPRGMNYGILDVAH